MNRTNRAIAQSKGTTFFFPTHVWEIKSNHAFWFNVSFNALTNIENDFFHKCEYSKKTRRDRDLPKTDSDSWNITVLSYTGPISGPSPLSISVIIKETHIYRGKLYTLNKIWCNESKCKFRRNSQFRFISQNTIDLFDGINFHRFKSNAQSFDWIQCHGINIAMAKCTIYAWKRQSGDMMNWAQIISKFFFA